MANRARVCVTAVIMVILQTVVPAWSEGPNPDKKQLAGFRTDRLTPKQLATWNRIVDLVHATGRDDRIKHPELHALWQWAGGSRIPIDIVFADHHPSCRNCGARLVIEESVDLEKERSAILFLYTGAVGQARLPHDRLRSRFKPFAGLGKYERFAEAIGHELAHLHWLLTEEERLHLYFEYERQAEECRRLLRQIGYARVQEQDPQRCLNWIHAVSRQLEAPAETVERKIWRELLENR